MEVYLRLMFLKFGYRLGYDSLCREVADSILGRGCRTPLDGRVRHPTTLVKLTTRCGTGAVDGCKEALLAKSVEAKLLGTVDEAPARLDPGGDRARIAARGERCAPRPPHAPSAPRVDQARRRWPRKKRIISADASGPMGSV